jgi:hypothetical protein
MLAPRQGAQKLSLQIFLANFPCKLSLDVGSDMKAAAWSQLASRQQRHCDCARPLRPSTFCLLQSGFPNGVRDYRDRLMAQLYAGKRPIWKGMRELYESLCGSCRSLPICLQHRPTGESAEFFLDVAPVAGLELEKSRARKRKFAERNQADLGCPAVLLKIFRFAITPNQQHAPHRPASARRAYASSRWCQARNARRRMMLSRTAKSCGPGAPMLALRFAGYSRETTVAKESGHRGARSKTIVQGRPE